MDTAQSPTSHYAGESGKDYIDKKFDGRLTTGRKFQAEYFAPHCSTSTDVVDFGCGDGTILRYVSAKSKTGVELNPACHAEIAHHNQSEQIPIQVVPTLHDLESSLFDVAISNHCLEHVPSPQDSLKEIHRVLRPGGKLVIVVPFDDWRATKNSKWRPDDADQHLFTWSPLSFGNLIASAGFQIDSVDLKTQAWSPKFFFLKERFGDTAFRMACWAFSVYRNSREIICIARKNAE
jgi:SAM-dependent methyltransferase